jgi:hypothetical protein
MDAIIGRYRVRMEESGLVLKHAAGINFDLTVEETLALFDFINVYRETLLALKPVEPETDPRLERIIIPTEEKE